MTRDSGTQCCFPSSAVLTTMEHSEDNDSEYTESETTIESDNDSEYLIDSHCSNEKVGAFSNACLQHAMMMQYNTEK